MYSYLVISEDNYRSLLCMNQIIDKIGSYKSVPNAGKTSVTCMPACQDQIHFVEVTSSAFPNKATFSHRDEQCLLIQKLRSLCQNQKSKSETMMERYPHLCSNVSLNYQRCINAKVDPYQDSGLDLRTQALLEHKLFKYAKENLVIVNIYIKVVKISKLFI